MLFYCNILDPLNKIFIIGAINQCQNMYIEHLSCVIFCLSISVPIVYNDSLFWPRREEGGRHSCGSSIQYQQLGSARSAEGWEHFFKWIDTVLIPFRSDEESKCRWLLLVFLLSGLFNFSNSCLSNHQIEVPYRIKTKGKST